MVRQPDSMVLHAANGTIGLQRGQATAEGVYEALVTTRCAVQPRSRSLEDAVGGKPPPRTSAREGSSHEHPAWSSFSITHELSSRSCCSRVRCAPGTTKPAQGGLGRVRSDGVGVWVSQDIVAHALPQAVRVTRRGGGCRLTWPSGAPWHAASAAPSRVIGFRSSDCRYVNL